MIVRVTKFTIAFTLIALVCAWIFSQLFGGNNTPPPPHVTTHTITPTAKAWSGRANNEYATSFVRGTDTITLNTITFAHLDTASTSINASFTVVPGAPGQPSWLNH